MRNQGLFCIIEVMDFTHATFIEPDVADPASYFVCPQCGSVASRELELLILDEKFVTCPICGEGFGILSAQMMLRHAYSGLAKNPESAVDMLWFHVSEKSPEEMDFESDREMHVGQMESVEHYVSTHPRFEGKNRYLYSLQFHSDAVLYARVIDDENDWVWAEHLFRGMSVSDLDVDGFVYLNRFEAPGSLSVVARRCAFDVLEVTRLEG